MAGFLRRVERRSRGGGAWRHGPSWKAPNWPIAANGELVSALDGNWPAVEKAIAAKLGAKAADGKGKSPEPKSPEAVAQATRDSVRALMMIRAYRTRGHLNARLDPLGLAPPKDFEELHPSSYGFSEADYDRPIFIDGVMGLTWASIKEMLPILRRTYCDTIGYEFVHMSDPAEKAWMQARIEGADKAISFTPEGKRAILNKLIEAEGFENSSTSATPARNASVSTAARAWCRRWSRSSSAAARSGSRTSSSAWRIAAG